MSEAYSKVHVDLDALPALSSPWRALGSRGVALGLIALPEGEGYTFTHSHEIQEELYVVLEGEGTLLVDGEELPLRRGDLVRVSPEARRALRSTGPGRLFVLAAGGVPAGFPRDPNARYLIDDGIPHYDDLPPWCAGDPAVRARNEALRERMLRARERRTQRPEDSDPALGTEGT